MFLNSFGLILAIIGIYISFKIYQEKNSSGPMICFLDGNCEDVLNSKYSKILGIGLEYFGLIFYGLLAFNYLSFFLNFQIFSENLIFIITMMGLLFSIYLTIIQRLIIKKWCTWCLFSALTTLLLFIVILIK